MEATNQKVYDIKGLLTEIADFLNNNPNEYESRDLWDILTALRGPDDGDAGKKYTTTSRIRGALGLGLAIGPNNLRGSSNVSEYAVVSHTPPQLLGAVHYTDHFGEHYNRAVRALTRLGYVNKEVSSDPLCPGSTSSLTSS